MTVVLLGTQRFEPNLREAAEAIGVRGRVALITCGWQERELEDEALTQHLGGDTVNLQLHRRGDLVFGRDPEFQAAYHRRTLRAKQLQDFYRVRLEHLKLAANVIGSRSAPAWVLEEEWQTSVRTLQLLDRHHARHLDQLRRLFLAEWDPATRPQVQRQRAQLAEALSDVAAVAIAGGHVATLVNRLWLFGFGELLGDLPVLAWSAGAMAITERVVVFHDDPPHGIDVPQVMDVGLGLAPGILAFPSPETRLALDDLGRMRTYAERFSRSRCLALPKRSWAVLEDGEVTEAHGVLELHAEEGVREVAP
jgi:hypothetical protein